MDILNYYFKEEFYTPNFKLNTVYSNPYVKSFRNNSVTSINEASNKKLRVLDFDDTLAKVDAKIYVSNGDKKFELTPAEFAVYQGQPGDTFNFKEFDTVIKRATPISKNIEILKKYAADPTCRTTILTARQLAYPVKHYLKKNFNLDVYVVALGNSNPRLKADYIEKQIRKGFNDIVFIDDSIKNVYAVKSLQSMYPEVNLIVKHTTEAEKL